MISDHHPVTELLRAWKAGDDEAFRKLHAIIDGQLKVMVKNALRDERRIPLHTTTLLQETYKSIVGNKKVDWESRRQFFSVVSKSLRHAIIDAARKLDTQKHGAGLERVPLFEETGSDFKDIDKMIAIDQALTELGRRHKDAEQLLELKFFGGLANEEISAETGIPIATVGRRIALGKAWIYRFLNGKMIT